MLLCFETRAAQIVVWVENGGQIWDFYAKVKLGEEWAKDLSYFSSSV